MNGQARDDGEQNAEENGQLSDYEDAVEIIEEDEQMEIIVSDEEDNLDHEELARIAAEELEELEAMVERERRNEEEIDAMVERERRNAEEIDAMADEERRNAEEIEAFAEAERRNAEEMERYAEEQARLAEAEEEWVEEQGQRIQDRLANAEQAQELDRVDYDIAIPSQHSYLDMNLTRVEGYNYWLEGQEVNLFLIPLDVIVIPGQTLPLRIRERSRQFSMVRALLDGRHKTFGAVYLEAEREQMLLDGSWSQCGVTVQIVEVSDETPHEIVLMCKGRQRFKTISTQRRAVLTAKVKILADHIPPRLYDPLGKLRDSFKYSSHPLWYYKLHDVYGLVASIKEEISKYSPLVKVDVAPNQPDMFSYWLISAMPFKFNQRVQMLRENSLVVRLKSQLEHVKELHKFDYCCHVCGTDIVNSRSLVSMSADSPFFVNPSGHAFELITAYSTQHTVAEGEPVTKDSWFPGYAWNFLKCLQCDCFLGWKFTAVVPDTLPRVFYGIQRKAVKVLRHSETETEEGTNTVTIGFGGATRLFYI